MKDINNAWEILGDPEERRLFDFENRSNFSRARTARSPYPEPSQPSAAPPPPPEPKKREPLNRFAKEVWSTMASGAIYAGGNAPNWVDKNYDLFSKFENAMQVKAFAKAYSIDGMKIKEDALEAFLKFTNRFTS